MFLTYMLPQTSWNHIQKIISCMNSYQKHHIPINTCICSQHSSSTLIMQHMYYFQYYMRTTSLGLRLLRVVDVIKTWLLHKFYMLRFYRLIITKKTNYYCKKTCESKINLKHTIFCKHMAILCINMTQPHHTKVMELPFPFLHLHKNYSLFKTIYQAMNKLNS